MAVQQDITLYDWSGAPITSPGITPPPIEGYVEAGADEVIIDRYRGYFSRNLTPGRLARIQEAADGGDPAEWFGLCEEMLEKDMKFASLFQTRTAQLTGLQRDVMAPSKIDESLRDKADEIADFCSQALEATNFDELLEDMMDAIPKPFSVDWIYWGFDTKGRVVPKKFCKIPGQHLRWSYKEDVLRIFDPSNPVVGPDGDWGMPLDPTYTVRSMWNIRRDNHLRSGLMRTLSWYYMFKIMAWKDLASYADRYGMPIRIAKLPAVQYKDKEIMDRIRTSLRRLGSDGSGVFTQEAELQIVAASGKGGDVFKQIIDLVNKEAAGLVFGHELSSESSPGSGQLGISAALVQQQHVLESDCKRAGEIVRRDVFRWMTEWNYGPDAVMNGLTPTLWFDYEEPPDLQGEANYLQTVKTTWPEIEFSESQIRDKFGIDEPIDAADTLGGQSPQAGVGPDGQPLPGGAPGGAPGGGVVHPEPLVKGALPVVTIHSAPNFAPQGVPGTLGRRRRRMGPSRYRKAAQARVDRLAQRSIAASEGEAQQIQREIIGVLKSVLADGGSYQEARARVIRTYRTLSVGDITKLLEQGMIMTRLAGLNGG